jgi:hypothetical protein
MKRRPENRGHHLGHRARRPGRPWASFADTDGAPAATLRVKSWPEPSKWDDRRRRPRSNSQPMQFAVAEIVPAADKQTSRASAKTHCVGCPSRIPSGLHAEHALMRVVDRRVERYADCHPRCYSGYLLGYRCSQNPNSASLLFPIIPERYCLRPEGPKVARAPFHRRIIPEEWEHCVCAHKRALIDLIHPLEAIEHCRVIARPE